MLCSQTKRARLGLQGSPVPRRNASQACTASACRAPRSDQWRRASRRVFCCLGDLLEVSSSHCGAPDAGAPTPSPDRSGLNVRDFRCGVSLSSILQCGLARIIAARGTPSPRPDEAMDREEAAHKKARLAPPPTKQGWLHKKGGTALSAERKRWFVLQGAGSGGYFAVFEGGEWRASRHDTMRGHPRGGPRREHIGYLHS